MDVDEEETARNKPKPKKGKAQVIVKPTSTDEEEEEGEENDFSLLGREYEKDEPLEKKEEIEEEEEEEQEEKEVTDDQPMITRKTTEWWTDFSYVPIVALRPDEPCIICNRSPRGQVSMYGALCQFWNTATEIGCGSAVQTRRTKGILVCPSFATGVDFDFDFLEATTDGEEVVYSTFMFINENKAHTDATYKDSIAAARRALSRRYHKRRWIGIATLMDNISRVCWNNMVDACFKGRVDYTARFQSHMNLRMKLLLTKINKLISECGTQYSALDKRNLAVSFSEFVRNSSIGDVLATVSDIRRALGEDDEERQIENESDDGKTEIPLNDQFDNSLAKRLDELLPMLFTETHRFSEMKALLGSVGFASDIPRIDASGIPPILNVQSDLLQHISNWETPSDLVQRTYELHKTESEPQPEKKEEDVSKSRTHRMYTEFLNRKQHYVHANRLFTRTEVGVAAALVQVTQKTTEWSFYAILYEYKRQNDLKNTTSLDTVVWRAVNTWAKLQSQRLMDAEEAQFGKVERHADTKTKRKDQAALNVKHNEQLDKWRGIFVSLENPRTAEMTGFRLQDLDNPAPSVLIAGKATDEMRQAPKRAADASDVGVAGDKKRYNAQKEYYDRIMAWVSNVHSCEDIAAQCRFWDGPARLRVDVARARLFMIGKYDQFPQPWVFIMNTLVKNFALPLSDMSGPKWNRRMSEITSRFVRLNKEKKRENMNMQGAERKLAERRRINSVRSIGLFFMRCVRVNSNEPVSQLALKAAERLGAEEKAKWLSDSNNWTFFQDMDRNAWEELFKDSSISIDADGKWATTDQFKGLFDDRGVSGDLIPRDSIGSNLVGLAKFLHSKSSPRTIDFIQSVLLPLVFDEFERRDRSTKFIQVAELMKTKPVRQGSVLEEDQHIELKGIVAKWYRSNAGKEEVKSKMKLFDVSADKIVWAGLSGQLVSCMQYRDGWQQTDLAIRYFLTMGQISFSYSEMVECAGAELLNRMDAAFRNKNVQDKVNSLYPQEADRERPTQAEVQSFLEENKGDLIESGAAAIISRAVQWRWDVVEKLQGLRDKHFRPDQDEFISSPALLSILFDSDDEDMRALALAAANSKIADMVAKYNNYYSDFNTFFRDDEMILTENELRDVIGDRPRQLDLFKKSRSLEATHNLHLLIEDGIGVLATFPVTIAMPPTQYMSLAQDPESKILSGTRVLQNIRDGMDNCIDIITDRVSDFSGNRVIDPKIDYMQIVEKLTDGAIVARA